MIKLENWYSQALEKLDAEKKAVTGQKEKAMSGQVLAAIKDFCKQEEEFAQAVVQGKSFADCMRSVANGVGQSISDIDAYKKAVAFYFPGAKVHMQLTVDLIGDAAAPVAEPEETHAPAPKLEHKPAMILDLNDFL